MGAGKSAIGRQLARLLGLAFLDTDEIIQQCTGVDIPLIFEKEGEAGFRRRERKIIEEYSLRDGIVLATGGGVVVDAANRSCLANRGTVVYLQADVDTQLARTRRGLHRPLLEGKDPRARLEALFLERDPLYREIAHLTVPTDGRRVRAVAQIVYSALRAMPQADDGR